MSLESQMDFTSAEISPKKCEVVLRKDLFEWVWKDFLNDFKKVLMIQRSVQMYLNGAWMSLKMSYKRLIWILHEFEYVLINYGF